MFTHFSEESLPALPKPKQESPKRPKKKKKKQQPKPREQKKVQGGGVANSIVARPPVDTGPHAGPYGYTEKGTFFTDSHFKGFPERIDIVYQGFIWAFTMHYPDQPSLLHGGVHTILADKVKRETLDLSGDYIVRVTGRTSPYNINRLTFHTKNGKQYGPWGDRHSEESIDFDVSAPAGHALAYFSGSIDFGVPLRSVSFHWRPIE